MRLSSPMGLSSPDNLPESTRNLRSRRGLPIGNGGKIARHEGIRESGQSVQLLIDRS
jgi:hypothetical protein